VGWQEKHTRKNNKELELSVIWYANGIGNAFLGGKVSKRGAGEDKSPKIHE